MAEKHGGVHFRMGDGSVYFVRDEVLQACKISGDELKGAERDLKRGGKPVITDSVYIEREMAPLEFSPIGGEQDLAAAAKVAPTVMCCW